MPEVQEWMPENTPEQIIVPAIPRPPSARPAEVQPWELGTSLEQIVVPAAAVTTAGKVRRVRSDRRSAARSRVAVRLPPAGRLRRPRFFPRGAKSLFQPTSCELS